MSARKGSTSYGKLGRLNYCSNTLDRPSKVTEVFALTAVSRLNSPSTLQREVIISVTEFPESLKFLLFQKEEDESL